MKRLFSMSLNLSVAVMLSSPVWAETLAPMAPAAAQKAPEVVTYKVPPPTPEQLAAAQAAQEAALKKEFEHLDFANGLFQRSLYEMAQNEYQQFIESYPQSVNTPKAYFGLAESRFFLQNYPAAIDAYKKYIETPGTGEELAAAKIRLGHVFVLTNQPQEALTYLQAVDVKGVIPSFQQLLYYSLGQAYQSLNDIPKTMESFYKATEVQPKTNYTILSYLQMGDVMLAQKDYGRAGAFYERAAQEGLTDQQKATALFKQGQSQSQVGDLSKAVEYFEALLKNYEKEEIAVDGLYQLLWVYTALNQPQAVTDTYTKYKHLTTEDAKFINVQHLVIDADVALKKFDEALAMTDKAIAVSTADPTASRRNLIKKVQVLSQAERYQEALKIIEENAQNLTQAKDQILMLQAEAYYGLKDYAKAFTLYEQVTKEFPNTPAADQALYGMAFAKNSAGETKPALEFFTAYSKDGKDENNRRKALYNAILLNAKENLITEAIADAQTYLSTFPTNEQAQKVLFLLGTLYGQAQKYEEAVDIFTRYVVTYPESEHLGEAYFALAYQSQLAGRLDQAQLYYEKAAKSESDKDRRYSSFKNLAAIYLNKNNTAQAAATIEQMTADYKDNDLDAASYLWLADYYMKEKKLDDVLRVLQAAKNNTRLKDGTGGVDYFLAEAHRQKGNIDEAIPTYDKVIALQPPSQYLAEAKIGKGLALISKQSFVEARQILSEALESNQDNNTLAMKSRYALGELEEKQGNAAEAVKYFMLVAVLYKNDQYGSQALFKAGELLETQGKTQEARRAYEEIVTGYPQSPLIEQVKERIEGLRGK